MACDFWPPSLICVNKFLVKGISVSFCKYVELTVRWMYRAAVLLVRISKYRCGVLDVFDINFLILL